MLQHHLHPTERGIYAFSMLCFIGFVSLLPWDAGSPVRSMPGALASLAHARTVTASVEEAQNFAAARLCRSVVSGARCETIALPPAAL